MPLGRFTPEGFNGLLGWLGEESPTCAYQDVLNSRQEIAGGALIREVPRAEQRSRVLPNASSCTLQGGFASADSVLGDQGHSLSSSAASTTPSSRTKAKSRKKSKSVSLRLR